MPRTVLATAFVLAGLAGCASGGSGSPSATSGSAAVGSSSSPAAGHGGHLATGATSVGTVVVDGTGLTVYAFDQDTVGAEGTACTGQCVDFWPEVTSSTAPVVTGVTGEVGTAPGLDGAHQVTLGGHRLYTFFKDTQAGDVAGQGFGNAWWVVSPEGEPIKGP